MHLMDHGFHSLCMSAYTKCGAGYTLCIGVIFSRGVQHFRRFSG